MITISMTNLTGIHTPVEQRANEPVIGTQ